MTPRDAALADALADLLAARHLRRIEPPLPAKVGNTALAQRDEQAAAADAYRADRRQADHREAVERSDR